MNKKNKFLQLYIEYFVEWSKGLSNIGLWHGKMGAAIYLLHLSRITQNEEYEKESSKLIDAVYDQISLNLPYTFDNGLLGIGCGFEYIINNGFIDTDSNEILSEMDFLVMNLIDSRTINNLNLDKGICGIGYYLYCRLKKRMNDNETITILKLKEYLIYMLDWLEDMILKTTDQQNCNDSYFLLTRLYNLDVLSYKIEKLISICLHKLVDSNRPITDNYELLGIPSLKILKPWI